MQKSSPIIKVCEVVSVSDDTDGARIQARLLPEDFNTLNEDLPFAFPLLPKMFFVKPKVGESVLIICTNPDDGNSDRFYIGPVISQPLNHYFDPYYLSSRSLFKGSIKAPLEAISMNADTEGAFPKDKDVAIMGRDLSDVILKDDSVHIRCGVHHTNKANKSDIVFNKKDPAYIKLKYGDARTYKPRNSSIEKEYKSTATIVADKINLISHDSKDYFNVTNKEELITDDEMQQIINAAHPLPYGDKLVEFLQKLWTWAKGHTHPFPGCPPCQGDTFLAVDTFNLEDILSSSIRIN